MRTVFGYVGFEQWDLIFFYVDNVFGGLMPPCAAFLFIYFVFGLYIPAVISMIVAVSVIIIDYLAPGPPWVRLIIFLAVLLGLFAYVPPKFLHRVLEIEEAG